MKKLRKITAILSSCALLFGVFLAGCSSDDSSDGSDIGNQNTGSDSGTQEADGTTTLKIQENASAGFVSTTGKVQTEFGGWTGSGYIDGVTNGGNIVYTVNAEEDISNAKIALHYLATEVTRVRGACVTVNGTLLNESSPFAMTTDKKVKKANAASSDWKDTGYLENVSLKKGSNSILITGAASGTYTAVGGSTITIDSGNSGCLNYVDYLIVNGKGISAGSASESKSFYTFSYSSENETAGSVSSTSANGSVEEDSSITLTATANSGWKFECWTDGSTENPYTFTVSGNKYVMAHFVPENYTAPAGLVGYASATSDSGDAYTITGGAGASSGNTVTISSYTDLTSTYSSLISGDEPAVITISGTISTAEQTNPLYSVKVNVGSNKTIYGDTTNQGQLRNIELNIEGENVIVRNMKLGEVIGWDGFTKSGADDAMCLNGATHVWIDHCEFQSHLTPQDLNGKEITSGNSYYSTDEDWTKDFYDGLLDIKNGSTWITISNCYFHDHWKAVLCASGDNGPDKNPTTGATDEDMRVTFYGNYFKNVNARQPLFRYGKGHILNNYFDAGTQSDSASCVNVRAGSELYIEGNTFANFNKTTGDKVVNGNYIIGFFFADSKTTYGNVSGKWTSVSNNNYNTSYGSSSYKPLYQYTAASYPATAPTPGTDVGVGCNISY